MTPIPDDILEAEKLIEAKLRQAFARQEAVSNAFVGGNSAGLSAIAKEPVDLIAQARLAERLAERERCAALVDPSGIELAVPAEGSPAYFDGYRQGLLEAARRIRSQP